MVDDAHDTGTGHPVLAGITRIETTLGDLTDAPVWSLTTSQTRHALIAATRAQARLVELEARLLAHAEATDAGVETGVTSTANWLAHATKATHPEAHRRVHLAAALAQHPITRDAMALGHVLAEQAAVITSAVETLPEETEVREQCEKHLVARAEHHDARELRILGRHVLEVVDPDLADAHEAALLEKQERNAEKKTSFSMREVGDGTWQGRFTLPDLEASALRKALMAIAAPKHQRATGGTYDHQTPSREKLGQAFAEYVMRYPADKLPHTGGLSATVVVTMPYETLLGGLKAACLNTGEMISPARSRMLCCEAQIIPAVLGTASQVLDQGRRTRFQTETQRIALAIEQKHCQHGGPNGGCDVPAAFCHVHHKTFWTNGGHTNTTDAELLCPRHHAFAHRDPPTPPSPT